MPEDTITAKTNSVYYYTQRYSSLLTTIFALVTTVIAIFGVQGEESNCCFVEGQRWMSFLFLAFLVKKIKIKV